MVPALWWVSYAWDRTFQFFIAVSHYHTSTVTERKMLKCVSDTNMYAIYGLKAISSIVDVVKEILEFEWKHTDITQLHKDSRFFRFSVSHRNPASTWKYFLLYFFVMSQWNSLQSLVSSCYIETVCCSFSSSNRQVWSCSIMVTYAGNGEGPGAALISQAWRTWMRQRQARQNTHSFLSQCRAALLIKPYPTWWIMQQLASNPLSPFCCSPHCIQLSHPVACIH